MAVSRFAHYLKAMMRDKIGSFMSRTDAENFLNRWITKYVMPDDSGFAGREGAVSFARGARRRRGGARQAGRLPRRDASCGRTSNSMN